MQGRAADAGCMQPTPASPIAPAGCGWPLVPTTTCTRGPPTRKAMEKIHAIEADGRVITGVEVFRRLYEAVGERRPPLARTVLPAASAPHQRPASRPSPAATRPPLACGAVQRRAPATSSLEHRAPVRRATDPRRARRCMQPAKAHHRLAVRAAAAAAAAAASAAAGCRMPQPMQSPHTSSPRPCAGLGFVYSITKNPAVERAANSVYNFWAKYRTQVGPVGREEGGGVRPAATRGHRRVGCAAHMGSARACGVPRRRRLGPPARAATAGGAPLPGCRSPACCPLGADPGAPLARPPPRAR